MLTKVSRLTSKGQATIPSAIRKQLHLESGDRIAFKVFDDRVEIARATPIDIEFMQSQESNLATEWLAAEDEAAYADLSAIRYRRGSISVHRPQQQHQTTPRTRALLD